MSSIRNNHVNKFSAGFVRSNGHNTQVPSSLQRFTSLAMIFSEVSSVSHSLSSPPLVVTSIETNSFCTKIKRVTCVYFVVGRHRHDTFYEWFGLKHVQLVMGSDVRKYPFCLLEISIPTWPFPHVMCAVCGTAITVIESKWLSTQRCSPNAVLISQHKQNHNWYLRQSFRIGFVSIAWRRLAKCHVLKYNYPKFHWIGWIGK